MVKIVLVIVVCSLLASDGVCEDVSGKSKDRLRQISKNLKEQRQKGERSRSPLTVTIDDDIVTVTGKIESVAETQSIVDAIKDVPGIAGIQFNIGINSEPAAWKINSPYPYGYPIPYPYPYPYPYSGVNQWNADIWKQELNWDDGSWQLDFHRKESAPENDR